MLQTHITAKSICLNLVSSFQMARVCLVYTATNVNMNFYGKIKLSKNEHLTCCLDSVFYIIHEKYLACCSSSVQRNIDLLLVCSKILGKTKVVFLQNCSYIKECRIWAWSKIFSMPPYNVL